ncbi:MAG: hypothetical protein RMY34_32050 [Aulosira sp. DedQUE10]|nr:hypothetical protein [Aulosira sp. DedQUE10]
MEMVTSWERKAIQVERRATITKILKLCFRDIDASLEAIILGIIISSLKFLLAIAGELKLVPNPS